jgi:hypothetical protein
MAYASGKYALGICDRCGIRCRYIDMRPQPVNGLLTEMRVCPECLDLDTSQPAVRARITALLGAEGVSLRYPRPEPPLIEIPIFSRLPHFTYYVDPVEGDDRDSGTSIETAWKTTLMADAAALVPGETIGYKYGGEWLLYRKLGMSSDEAGLPSDIYTGGSDQY